MNRLLLTISAIIACLPAAHGQVFWRLSGGGTANVAAGATSNMTQIVNVRNTFAAAFSSAPVVVFTPPGESSTNSITITTTNFVLDIGVAGAVVPWIAIGAP